MARRLGAAPAPEPPANAQLHKEWREDKIRYENRQLKIDSDFADVAQLVQANAVLNTDPSSLKEKIILLHERMGHAHTEAMCTAIGGDSPAWTHCDVTPAQVRRIMEKYLCHLAKRPRPSIAPPT